MLAAPSFAAAVLSSIDLLFSIYGQTIIATVAADAVLWPACTVERC